MSRASFLMCRPTFYGIAYVINPWMDLRRQPNRPLALRQWQSLRRTLQEDLGATVHCCRARPGLPDMTFTANAGLAHRGIFIPSRFRYRERAGEAPHFTRWFRAHGYRVLPLPAGHSFEGAGDALLMGDRLFAGYRFRSDIQTHAAAGRALGVRVLSLELVNPYFYHLDTCFMPLSRGIGDLLPGRIRPVRAASHPGERRRPAAGAARGGVSVRVQRGLGRPKSGDLGAVPVLARELKRRGFTVFPLDLSEFLKAGGAARCLTLRLT